MLKRQYRKTCLEPPAFIAAAYLFWVYVNFTLRVNSKSLYLLGYLKKQRLVYVKLQFGYDVTGVWLQGRPYSDNSILLQEAGVYLNTSLKTPTLI